MSELDAEVKRVASATARRILNKYPDYVDDVVSQTMICWEDWKQRGVKSPKAWAREVAKNLALEIIKEEKKQTVLAEKNAAWQPMTSTNDGLLNLMTTDCQNTLIALVAITEQARESSLDEIDQAIYECVYRRNLTYQETAAELDIEEDAVRQRVHRLIVKVRNQVHARIRGDKNLRQMLQHFLDDPKWLGRVLSDIMLQIAQKGKDALEKAIRNVSLISL